ncbi:MAG: HIT family protein [Cyclobacteriaceae bacterium]
MSTLFTKIINREIPGHIVAENDKFIAFLDIMPLVPGHTLVVPKKEVDYIFDNDNETLSSMIVFAKQVAKAIKETVPCKRVGVAVIGLEVPHTHVHLVPLNTMDDINFTRPKLKPSHSELSAVASQIAKAYNS